MVAFAPAALAHHPEISADQVCADGSVTIAYESVSWKTDGTSGSAHNDIRIEIQVNGSGPWIEVGSGSYNAGNSYRFSGSFDADAYAGDSIVVRARAVGPWTNGQGGGETRSTGAIEVDLVCTEDVTVTPSPQVCAVNQQGAPQGSVSFGIAPSSGAEVRVYTNSNFTGQVGGVLADGQVLALSPGTYYWQATATAGHTIDGASSGQFSIAPCSSSTVVVAGQCAVDAGGPPSGSVTVTIDPSSGATVVVSGPGGPYDFTGSGGTVDLAPGDYTWQATPGAGFTLDGATNGSFTVDPCEASVSVSGICLLDGDAGTGVIEVTITGSATVELFDGATLVDTLTSSGTVTVPEGRTYDWSAVAGAGFTLDGAASGSIDVEDCSRSLDIQVEGVCENDVPILRWTVTPIGFTATETTITWLDIDADDPLFSSVEPLSGEMVWPGAVVGGGKAIDWPGWVYVDKETKQPVALGTEGGTWMTGSDGYEATRPRTSIQFEVNPAAVVEVDYPGGEPTCAGPPDEVLDEEIDNDDDESAEVDDPQTLPFTGVDLEAMLAVAAVLVGSGWVLVRSARRLEGRD